MNTGEIISLKAYILCIRKMLDAIRGLGIDTPSTVILWIHEVERTIERGPTDA